MKTTRIKIDVHHRTLTFDFDGKVSTLNLSKAARFPHDSEPVATMEDFEHLVREHGIREVVKDSLDWVIQIGKHVHDAQIETKQQI